MLYDMWYVVRIMNEWVIVIWSMTRVINENVISVWTMPRDLSRKTHVVYFVVEN